MHVSITAHNTAQSTSSANLVSYLEKENKIIDENIYNNESFFNTDYESNIDNLQLQNDEIVKSLDNNRGHQVLQSSNYFMLNISPSFSELKHMEDIAKEELNRRGVKNESNVEQLYFNEQKDQLIKMQLKLYTKDVMVEYANNFEREIYINEDLIPNRNEKALIIKEVDVKYNDFLKSKNIISPIKHQENKSKEWISTSNIKELSNNGKSKSIEIDLNSEGKAIVNVPANALHLQTDGSYKIPKDIYENKIIEVKAKNTLKEIDYKLVEINNPYSKDKTKTAHNFELKDNKFSEPLRISFDSDSVIKKGSKYFVSEHLYNQKTEKEIISAIDRDFGKVKQNLYDEVATAKGFDVSKRPLVEKDLLWYGKIETTRSYKHTDLKVKENKELFKEIKEEQSKGSEMNKIKIELAKAKLHIDKFTNEVIKEGNTKGGNQYHAHVIVSRHDKTMKDPRNKISLSPLANHKEGNMNNGATVGFNRNNFFQKTENVFDQKFAFNRDSSKSYQAFKDQKLELNKLKGTAKNEAKNFLMKHTGLNMIKQNISPVQDIKKSLGISKIPTSFPKSVTDVVIKVAKKIISQGVEY